MPIDQAEAVTEFRAAGLGDPNRQFTAESLAGSGQAFRLTTGTASGVFVAEVRGNHLWIHGAGAAASSGLTAAGLALFDAMATTAGCEFIAFETARPGLARLAKKNGYRPAAVVMKKKVTR